MRWVGVAALCVLIVLAWPSSASAQVSDDALAPFVGKYTDTPGSERFVLYVGPKSSAVMRWRFERSCAASPGWPCDPILGISTLPGGTAVAALWSVSDKTLSGDVLYTNSTDVVDGGPIALVLRTDGNIDITQGTRMRFVQRVATPQL